ncbi:hypothetical protein [Cryobacterium aureum]|nr:hypothetical protein [Cryobacterium aureum]
MFALMVALLFGGMVVAIFNPVLGVIGIVVGLAIIIINGIRRAADQGRRG